MNRWDIITKVVKEGTPSISLFYFCRLCICQPPIDVLEVTERRRKCRQGKKCKRGGRRQCGRKGRCIKWLDWPYDYRCECPCKQQRGRYCVASTSSRKSVLSKPRIYSACVSEFLSVSRN
jgi:hypothetical protein